MRRFVVALALAALGLIFIGPGASAHAQYKSSHPANGARLDAAPEAVTITWTEPPEQSFTTVRVLDQSGQAFQQGEAQVMPDDHFTVRVALKDLPEGAYTVTWRTVSRADGHSSAGAFAFGLGVDASAASVPGGVRSAVATPSASALEIVGRWGLLVGLIAVVGAGVIGALNSGSPATARMLTAGAGVSLTGLVLFAEAQRRAAETGYSELFATDVGRALIYRAVLIALCAGAGLLAMRAARPLTLWVGAGSAALAMLVHVRYGHASAVETLTWAVVGAQWVHFLAAGIWIGGLAALLLVVRGLDDTDRGRAVKQFSFMAGIMLAAVVLMGIVRASNEIPSWSDLFSTAYGRWVLIKVALALGLASLGAINRYRNVPRSESSVTGLQRISRIELIVASAILVVAAVLASINPPAEGEERRAAPTPERIAVTGSDFGTSVRVRVEVLPGVPGNNQFSVRVSDYDTAEPVDAERVVLRFAYLDDPGVGSSELELEEVRAGSYRADGPNISLGGNWRVTVLVQRGAESVEVPVELGTRCREQELAEPGVAPIQVVDVGDGHTAQGYAEPGHMGPNEVHLTFLDASDQEVEVEERPTVTATESGGGGSETLKPRRLGPGHFVASSELEAGEYRIDFRASAHGFRMSGCFTLTIEEHG